MANVNDKRIDKRAVEVQLDLDDGTRMLGSLFVMPQQQRVSDLLSDNRLFLPFRGSDGMTYMLRKSRIAKVVELSQVAEEFDAYDRIVKQRQDAAGTNGTHGANGHDAGAG